MIPFAGFVAGVVAVVVLWGDHQELAWVAIGMIALQTIIGLKVQDLLKRERPLGIWHILNVVIIPINMALCLYGLFA